ncbi:hypothetical protein HK104_002356 [Borealophlyctis nickersoniae]|nr:hypothetical protein HK104_002356 [Borealophlyctis nickersoniae]
MVADEPSDTNADADDVEFSDMDKDMDPEKALDLYVDYLYTHGSPIPEPAPANPAEPTEPTEPVEPAPIVEPGKPAEPTPVVEPASVVKPKHAKPAKKTKTYKTLRFVEETPKPDTTPPPNPSSNPSSNPLTPNPRNLPNREKNPEATRRSSEAWTASRRSRRGQRREDRDVDSVAKIETWYKDTHGRDLKKIQEGLCNLLCEGDPTATINEWDEVKNGNLAITGTDPRQVYNSCVVVDGPARNSRTERYIFTGVARS